MNKKTQAYQTLKNDGKLQNNNLMIDILTKIKNSIEYGTNKEYNRIDRIKSLAKTSSLINHVINHMNTQDNPELAKLFSQFLVVVDSKITEEIKDEGSQNFSKEIENLHYFIEISSPN